MITMKRIRTTIGILFVGIFLFACTSAIDNRSYQGAQSSNEMNQILDQGWRQNQQIAQAKPVDLPSDVSNSLLPRLAVRGAASGQLTQKVEKFNIAANDMPANAFFMGLVKGTKYNMVVSPDVKGTVTLNLQNVSIDQALQAAQDNYGYQYQKTSYGYQVFPRALETRTFTVNYLDVTRSAQSNTLVSSGEISRSVGTNGGAVQSTKPTSGVQTTSKSAFWQGLGETLVAMVGTENGHQVIVNSAASVVVIKAYPNEFKQVADYLDSLQNNMTREVIIEAKVLEVELNDNYQAGIDWTMLGASQTTSGAISSNLTAITSSIFALDFSIKQVFSAVINMLSEQGNVQTLSSPRIATMNNQTAVIKVGKDEFFVTNVSSTTTASATSVTTQNLDLTPFFSGISLDVTPQISEEGDVILHIHPVISVVTDQTKTFKVNGLDQTLPLALSKIRESDNIVRAKNGQIIVIGGLMENNTSENMGGTPVLSKAPLVGALFRRNDQAHTKSELVILLRPTVMNGVNWTKQVKGLAGDFKGVDRAFMPGGHPKVFGAAGKQSW